jgi:hypothetical protein
MACTLLRSTRVATADRGQGRGVGLHLTAAGARARESAHEATEGFETRLTEALGPDRHQRLAELLEEMRSIIGELEPARPP